MCAPGVNRDVVYAAEETLVLPFDEFIAVAITGRQQVAPRHRAYWAAGCRHEPGGRRSSHPTAGAGPTATRAGASEAWREGAVMGFSVTAAAGVMTARPYRSLWRSSDACVARSLPVPMRTCRTLTAGMPPSR